MLDIVSQVRPHNLVPMLQVAIKNPDLITYLVGELLKNHRKKVDSLRIFMPTAKDEDWTLIDAGQRAQVMKKDPRRAASCSSAPRSSPRPTAAIAGLLGASPGASTAVPIMLGLLKSCFPEQYPSWEPALRALIPTFGEHLEQGPRSR